MGAPVILGGFVFDGFEVPDKINIGGEQKTVVHMNVGGLRTVQAMGPVPADISWSGRFRGNAAVARALSLDAMRISGSQYMLSWLGVAKNVVIKTFRADTEKAFEVPYQITCEVVDSEGGAASDDDLTSSLGGMVDDDMTSLTSNISNIANNIDDDLSITSAVSGLQSAISSAGTLASASSSVISDLASTAGGVVSSIDDAVSSLDNAIGLVSVSPDGLSAPQISSWLTSVTDDVTTQSFLSNAYGYASRIATNLGIGSI